MLSDKEYICELERLFLEACELNDTSKIKTEFEVIKKLYKQQSSKEPQKEMDRIGTGTYNFYGTYAG